MKTPEYCGTVAGPRAGQQIERGSIPGSCKKFLCSRRGSKWIWDLPSNKMNG